MTTKYSSVLMHWLTDLGYTHCFFVAGGNSMHLLDGARSSMTCIPVVHEVAAGIATEYFNEAARAQGSPTRAFALVTAGPGLTNLITALAGAFLESRELLVVGGQAKSTDLAWGTVRQRGIQEVDGVALARPVCVATARIEQPISRSSFAELVNAGRSGRPGPVFIEICLNAQGAPVEGIDLDGQPMRTLRAVRSLDASAEDRLHQLLASAHRPVLLLGGGTSRGAVEKALPALRQAAMPVMTTWNGADRLAADDPVYAGRPNTWGQRAANVLLQQADLILALGTRLGLQQTGFNWQEFAPLAKVVQVDIDPAELQKGHPIVDLPLEADADTVLECIADRLSGDWSTWLAFCQDVRQQLPVVELCNTTGDGYLDPYAFVAALADVCDTSDVVIPCSSGGAFTVTMQAFAQKQGQVLITDKGLASMGYGLSGAIGAAVASGRRTVLIEGDGGFTQNLQELATVGVNNLPLKIFLFSNEGYASIRMTQRNYFDGAYLGCDTRTGLGFPDWPLLFQSYGIPVLLLDERGVTTDGFAEQFAAPGPAAFVVPIDPEQTYFPKIQSRVTVTGGMESQPLHLMFPDLPEDVARRVMPYLHNHTRDQQP